MSPPPASRRPIAQSAQSSRRDSSAALQTVEPSRKHSRSLDEADEQSNSDQPRDADTKRRRLQPIAANQAERASREPALRPRPAKRRAASSSSADSDGAAHKDHAPQSKRSKTTLPVSVNGHEQPAQTSQRTTSGVPGGLLAESFEEEVNSGGSGEEMEVDGNSNGVKTRTQTKRDRKEVETEDEGDNVMPAKKQQKRQQPSVADVSDAQIGTKHAKKEDERTGPKSKIVKAKGKARARAAGERWQNMSNEWFEMGADGQERKLVAVKHSASVRLACFV